MDAELRAAAVQYAGDPAEELKYVPGPTSAQTQWCKAQALTSHDAKQAVLACLVRRPTPEATLFVGIVIDPRSGNSRISDAECYSWGYEMVLQRFAHFLGRQADRGGDGPNEVIADTLAAEPRRFHGTYLEAYERGWPDLPFPVPPLKGLATRRMLLTSMACFTPPLWLPDHVVGAVDDWIKVEKQVDAATAVPKPALQEGARHRVAQLLPNFQSTAPGYSIASWPRDSLPNATMSEWVGRLEAQARADGLAQ